MINAVLYSDQTYPLTAAIDARLVQMMHGRSGRVGYVASGREPDFHYFNASKSYYARLGLELAVFHDLDAPSAETETDRLLACDAIHLSGGDTFAFLSRLRRGGMLNVLRDWALNRGILIGVSAGSILMTPTIALDALFSGGRPQDVLDGHALDVVPFEYFPHAMSKPNYLEDLRFYSLHTSRPIIACGDGDGVVVSHGFVECVGEPVWIRKGHFETVKDMPLDAI